MIEEAAKTESVASRRAKVEEMDGTCEYPRQSLQTLLHQRLNEADRMILLNMVFQSSQRKQRLLHYIASTNHQFQDQSANALLSFTNRLLLRFGAGEFQQPANSKRSWREKQNLHAFAPAQGVMTPGQSLTGCPDFSANGRP